MARAGFPERAEQVLIASMVVGIGLIMQRASVDIYRAGLLILTVSTLLQIAVGNIPKEDSIAASLIRIALILALIAVIFALGALLVPVLSRMGR